MSRRGNKAFPGAGGEGEVPPAEAEAILDRIIRRKEAAWVDESNPGLGGLTPRQALDDPTLYTRNPADLAGIDELLEIVPV
jgi:hypothetical protein